MTYRKMLDDLRQGRYAFEDFRKDRGLDEVGDISPEFRSQLEAEGLCESITSGRSGSSRFSRSSGSCRRSRTSSSSGTCTRAPAITSATRSSYMTRISSGRRSCTRCSSGMASARHLPSRHASAGSATTVSTKAYTAPLEISEVGKRIPRIFTTQWLRSSVPSRNLRNLKIQKSFQTVAFFAQSLSG